MSDALWAATIAGSVAISVALLTQFAAEAYRRHRDGNAVAAALAGELSAYGTAMDELSRQLSAWLLLVKEGNRDLMKIRIVERQKDLLFDELVGKLGLLGVELVEKAVFVYGQIRAFRLAHELVSREHTSMTDEELAMRLTFCISRLHMARDAGLPLVTALRQRAHQRFLGRSMK